MEKYKCKLCLRSFSNGRALGGHMRSHMMNLPLARAEEASSRTIQLSFEAESASSSSSDEEDDKGLSYRLRENPKRSIRLVDPEFSFAAADTGSVILQDRESETESSKNNPTGRRSKRPWNHCNNNNYYNHNKNNNNNSNDSSNNNKKQQTLDHEPASSVSDTTTEEEVAFCLMMLSRDKWRGIKDQSRKEQHQQQRSVDDQYEEEEEEDEPFEDDEEFEDSDESLETNTKPCKNRGRYKCETCDKVFRSYQALGGHRASHKKTKVNLKSAVEGEHKKSGPTNCGGEVQKKIHECPVCFRIFASGQALGGHKRTHVIGSATATVFVPSSSAKFGNNFIDLNLPAPMDDDDASQIENSAVSDAEFVKTH